MSAVFRPGLLSGRHDDAENLDPHRFAVSLAAASNHVRKTSLGHQVEVFGFGQRTRNASGPFTGIQAGLQRRRSAGDHVADLQPSAWFEHPVRLAKNQALVLAQVDHAVRQDHVNQSILERQALGLSLAELDVGNTRPDRCLASPLQHGGGHIHANDPTLQTNPLGCQEGVHPAAAANIQDDLTRAQSRHSNRVAAAK